MDVALITCSELPDLSPFDIPLLKALAARGIDARPLIWNDPGVDWSEPIISIIRSTWDYHHQREVFLEWAQYVSQLHTLWNPSPLLHWNTHKSYLQDLEACGVPIIPTLWLVSGRSTNLTHLMQERGWTEIVIKPAVSADAYGAMFIKEETVAKGQQHLDHLLLTRDMLIQPFFPTVMSSGERSLIWIDGEVTHAVLRQPMLECDTSVQTILKEGLIIPQEEEVRLARKIINALSLRVLYARIDLVHGEDGQLRVMEVELVEPGLWLAWMPAAIERFADGIVREIGRVKS